MQHSCAKRDVGRMRWALLSEERAWMFIGSDDHAAIAGNLFSLIASARPHRLDANAYLRGRFRVLALWLRDRYLELAAKYWARRCAIASRSGAWRAAGTPYLLAGAEHRPHRRLDPTVARIPLSRQAVPAVDAPPEDRRARLRAIGSKEVEPSAQRLVKRPLCALRTRGRNRCRECVRGAPRSVGPSPPQQPCPPPRG
jgi:hypothetical protein